MEKFLSYFDPKSPIPLPERQARLLAAVLCGFYALAAIYLFVIGVTMLLQVASGNNATTLSWALGIIILSFLLAAITRGLWQVRHWAITFSALILTAALVYSLLGDIDQNSWLLAILKAIVIGPAIATGHLRLWKEALRQQQDST
jgi:hypothetical protein